MQLFGGRWEAGATILCLKTEAGPRGSTLQGPRAPHSCHFLPGAPEVEPRDCTLLRWAALPSQAEERKRTHDGGSGTNRTWKPGTSAHPKARRPVHSFVNLMDTKASQVLKKQSFLTKPCFLV